MMDDDTRRRIGRLFSDSGRCLLLPVDHGLGLGRIVGLERPLERLREFLQWPVDGFLMSPGLTAASADQFATRHAPCRVLTMDAWYADEGVEILSEGTLVTDGESAARMGADALKILMPWTKEGGERRAVIEHVAKAVEAGGRWSIPVMIEPLGLTATSNEERTAVDGDASRIAVEMGASVIKVRYPGRIVLREWTQELQVPIVILGGALSGSVEGLLSMAREAIQAGASGIVVGRNVWQREPEVARDVISQLATIVHG